MFPIPRCYQNSYSRSLHMMCWNLKDFFKRILWKSSCRVLLVQVLCWSGYKYSFKNAENGDIREYAYLGYISYITCLFVYVSLHVCAHFCTNFYGFTGWSFSTKMFCCRNVLNSMFIMQTWLTTLSSAFVYVPPWPVQEVNKIMNFFSPLLWR